MIKIWFEKLKALRIYAVSSSFSNVVIRNSEGIVLKTLTDTTVIPRTNNLLYVDGKCYQVTSNVFNYDEKIIYVYVGGSF